MPKRGPIPKKLLEPLVAQDLAITEIAARLAAEDPDVTVRRVSYALRLHGLREPVRRVVPHEKREWMRAAREDGVPVGWVAETAGVATHTVTRMVGKYPSQISQWGEIWNLIRRRPDLLELHREFAPKEALVHSKTAPARQRSAA